MRLPCPLVACPPRSHKRAVPADLFDRRLRALRRDRAARLGPERFLLDRAFDECLDRLRDIARPFERILLLGCPSADWPQRLSALGGEVEVFDPGPMFAARAGGQPVEEDLNDFGEARYDLCLAIGTLDTVNDLPVALQLLRRALRPDAPLIGAMSGGDTLPALRSALIEADRASGIAVARVHPRIAASSLAQLLASSGFEMPVIDVDRVRLRYSSLTSLVRDLRAMGATSMLADRPPPLLKAAASRASAAFAALGADGKTEEIVEILHFHAWNPPKRQAAG